MLTHIEVCLQKAEEQHPLAEIGRYTGEAFAYVKSSVALQRMDVGRRIPRWDEDWADRITEKHLQIDEHDLWIAAQAFERNYVMVTADPDFTDIIKAAVPDLRVNLIAK